MAQNHRFRVTGIGDFPIDMLRYDECYPERETDSAILMDRHQAAPRTVELAHLAEGRYWSPTVGRWESFGWKVS